MALNRVHFYQMSTTLTINVFKQYACVHCSVSEISEEERDNPGRDDAFVSNLPSFFNTSIPICSKKPNNVELLLNSPYHSIVFHLLLLVSVD